MANAVITGSSKGIGRGLAEEFLRRGHNVVISGRNEEDIERTVTALNASAGPARAIGQPCDVTQKGQVQALWDRAEREFRKVDFWINNAGHASARHTVHETPDLLVHQLVDGNLKGTIFGAQVAVAGFRRQGSGALYNMLGGSFQGKRLTPKMGVYSSTKAAVWKLTQYLVDENKDTAIVIGSISPGMLISDNWFEEQKALPAAEWQKVRPILNVLCDYVETATPWLVEEVLANRTSGKRIVWLNNMLMMRRFFDAFILRRERDLFSRYGL
jgi:NADP-dependent 3-hydroxy acid dehydrogenase YdfG